MASLNNVQGREIWVVNILFIDNSNRDTTTNSLVYANEKDAIEYADSKIDEYALENKMNVYERSPHLYKAENYYNEWYVTISIEQQMIL